MNVKGEKLYEVIFNYICKSLLGVKTFKLQGEVATDAQTKHKKWMRQFGL